MCVGRRRSEAARQAASSMRLDAGESEAHALGAIRGEAVADRERSRKSRST